VDNLSTTDEQLVARVAKAILIELGHVEPPARSETLPEFISDPDARRRLYGNCSRTKFWQLMQQPDAPQAYMSGRTKIRRTADHRAFIASRAAT
jgi:hypothetical protein